MAIIDPIADMLTRIRNGLIARHATVTVPASKMKISIADILAKEGYIKEYTIEKDEKGIQDTIKIELKYGPNNEKVVTGLKRISKPGLRVYAKHNEMPKVLGGMGIAIVSTSKGVMVGREAAAKGIGGEVLAYVW
ncbi:MAG: 30S ribosomal protein S8 [Christensenellales bacterium]|jgi:small subunit ribosomal protein S8